METLQDAGDGIIPELMDWFYKESDAEIQACLVQLIWQTRQLTFIPFLREALLRSESAIWKEAMDGLVILASRDALDALVSARSRRFPTQKETNEFQGWIEEAIEQTQERMPAE
jgi:hypothetical protein